eukprot:TRINITY_DN55881_c0_g1_i1.p1 TRINITY_DN55881_c0_g1~~TRINITY_DN55881_c0_g1_i1.p1  ORF type:complete len:442 (+),score=106.03 TRINITY_DN55881_c0_g1_i1:66-1391(+)
MTDGACAAQNQSQISDAFRRFDINKDGKIQRDEFGALFRFLDESSWADAKLDKLFKVADADASGSIDVNEFLDWVFGKTKKKKAKKGKKKAAAGRTATPPALPSKAGDASSSDDDSSSSSDDDGEAEGKAAPKQRAPKKQKVRKPKKPLYTVDELYDLLTMKDGKALGKLTLQELATMFKECREQGIGPTLPLLVPQSEWKDAALSEDVSPLEIGHLYALLDEHPDATAEDAREQVNNVKDICRSMETYNVKDIGLDPETAIKKTLFRRLLELLSAATCIDQDQLLAQFAWVQTGRFDLTDVMAEQVMEKVFLRSRENGDLLDEHIKSNDFMRMCHVCELTDNDGKKGIPHAQASLFFSNTMRNMAQLQNERAEKRARARQKKPKPSKARKAHKSIHGRLHMSLLMEELWKAWPDKEECTSPLVLTLMLLRRVQDGVAVAS